MPVDITNNPTINRHDFTGSETCHKCGMTQERYYASSWGCLADPPLTPAGPDGLTLRPASWEATRDEQHDPSIPEPNGGNHGEGI